MKGHSRHRPGKQSHRSRNHAHHQSSKNKKKNSHKSAPAESYMFGSGNRYKSSPGSSFKKVAIVSLVVIAAGGLIYFFKKPSNSPIISSIEEKVVTSSTSPKITPSATTTTAPITPVAKLATSKPLAMIITPTTVIQGEPVMLTIQGVASTSVVKKVTFAGREILFSEYKSMPTAFVGIDLAKKPGQYKFTADVADKNGKLQTLEKIVTVAVRPKFEKPLGIPDQLGGNSTTSQQHVVSVLEKENAELAALTSSKKTFWSEPFRFPIKEPIIITDPYGYSRLTGDYTITHKGTDFRAAIGTPVMAINRGVVSFATGTVVYGNMIAVDHGQGVISFYMHMSRLDVKEGDTVLPGQILGLSGDTGYAEGAHLHLTIRINQISIDPMKFLEFFK